MGDNEWEEGGGDFLGVLLVKSTFVLLDYLIKYAYIQD